MNNQIAFERVRPDEGAVQVFETDADLAYTPGDVVATPRGVGVVNAVLDRPFDFPHSGDGDVSVQASSDLPAFIVGMGGRSAPYRESALETGDLYQPRQADVDVEALAPPIAEHGFHRDAMRQNWGKRDLLEWWSHAGGLWRSARKYLKQERDVSDEKAREIASMRKDMVLGTNRWRTRF